ncbi:MAG TPA: TonB-dependent receptor plug domain-containing protein [Gemmatimonadaceae bacterium]|nr:TonB-dependent receptor plug domain-containing protein [Gemmatimonadaceae bacterium]
MNARHHVLSGVTAIALAHAGLAQTPRVVDSSFSDLRAEGNGVAALRTIVMMGFANEPADAALRAVVLAARLNITFDPQLSGLATHVTIPSHSRTASVALLEIAQAARLRVRVSAAGQIVVVNASPEIPARRASTADSTTRPVTLPVVVSEADRVERRAFATTATIGAVSFTRSELQSAPLFVEPDVLRAVQTMPGVAARSDYSAGFNVRGGEADQNLVLLDGYPIYNPYHLGGLFSTFIDPMVGRVDMRRGGLPAEFGGRLSGVLDVQSADATSTSLGGRAEVSLMSATASLGRAFGDGSGSWMIGARRTYADAIVDLFKPGAFPYHFEDGQAHLARTFGSGMRLSVTGYIGADVSEDDKSNDSNVHWGNGVLGATLSRNFDARPTLFGMSLGDSVVVAQRVSLTRFGSNVDVLNSFYHAADQVTDQRAGGSITTYRPTLSHTIGYEVSAVRLEYQANSALPGIADLFPFDSLRQRSGVASLFADQTWRPTPSLLIETGARFDAVEAARWSGLSPRLSIKYFVTPDAALTFAAGTYAQWMHSLGREEEPLEPLQFWVASDSLLAVSHSRDAVVGFEHWLSSRRLLHIETFYKRYDHLLVPNPYSDPGVHGDEFTTARGTSYGADVLLRQLEGGPFSGWLAYSYAVSSRIGADGVHYFPGQDRRHNLNLVGRWQAAAYTLSARMNVASGLPTTPILGKFVRERYDPVNQRWLPEPGDIEQNISAPLSSARLPWYGRVDVGVTRVGHIRGSTVSPYLSVVNLLNAKNPAAYLYDFKGHPTRTTFPNLPFVPTFGVTVAY